MNERETLMWLLGVLEAHSGPMGHKTVREIIDRIINTLNHSGKVKDTADSTMAAPYE
jgi:hypothetical protein